MSQLCLLFFFFRHSTRSASFFLLVLQKMQLKVYYLLLLSTTIHAFQIQFFGSNRYHNKLAVASLRFINSPTDIYTVKICVTNSKGSLDVVSTVTNVMVDSFGFTHFNFEEGLPVGSNYYFAAFAVNNPSDYATAGPITIYDFDNGSPTNSVTANSKETVTFPTTTTASKTSSPTNSVSGNTNSPTTGPTLPSTFNFPTQIPKPGSDNYQEEFKNGSLPIPAIVGIAIGSAAVATVTVALVFFVSPSKAPLYTLNLSCFSSLCVDHVYQNRQYIALTTHQQHQST